MESRQKLTEEQKKDREVIFKRLRIYQEKQEKKASEKAYENRLGPPIEINKNPSPVTVPSDPGFKHKDNSKSGGRYKKSKKTKRKAKKSKKTRKNRKSKSKRKTRKTRRTRRE
jgi:hypothetical protein